ncbi:hypothetical protein NC653_025230 [Populus alba x Populus x berolinensis]|uniref:Uncharacterized protein n=1 Tax=Populus alba x Populus x berolinensis TaxID=444605 RepID=A0AAD6MAT9_9ROSI|nr:hypothetical protein NC653_025230 [Populus alba x Populus x berolinensis]
MYLAQKRTLYPSSDALARHKKLHPGMRIRIPQIQCFHNNRQIPFPLRPMVFTEAAGAQCVLASSYHLLCISKS